MEEVTLEENGVVIHTAETEEEMWGWIAVHLSGVQFFDVIDNLELN